MRYNMKNNINNFILLEFYVRKLIFIKILNLNNI